MPSETESVAVQLVRALCDAPDGRPMQWRIIERLDGATTDADLHGIPSRPQKLIRVMAYCEETISPMHNYACDAQANPAP